MVGPDVQPVARNAPAGHVRSISRRGPATPPGQNRGDTIGSKKKTGGLVPDLVFFRLKDKI